MKSKPYILDTWNLLSVGTLIGCLLFFIYFDQDFNFLGARNAIASFTPFKLLNFPTSTIKPTKSSNFSLGDKDTLKNKIRKNCNMFDGRWVYYPHETPSYDPSKCPFVEEKMSCKSNERPDLEYAKWKWEAQHCDIPSFNGTDMLEKLRNKRMILVGDSLNRNMWESLACLLFNSLPPAAARVDETKAYKTFWNVKEYNFTLVFHWSPFLVEINTNHESGKKVLVLDKLSPNSEKWSGADIMVFNSGHWWDQRGRFKAWDLFEYEGKLISDMSIELAYERGLKTWATWIERNINPNRTTIVFRSISAPHKFPQYDQWCYNKTKPIIDDSYVPVFPKSMVDVVENLIKRMKKFQVKYLNITKMSEHRIDAHPSMYRFKDGNMLSKKYNNNLGNYADCTHWCLPGVPDTWNRLLYASLFF